MHTGSQAVFSRGDTPGLCLWGKDWVTFFTLSLQLNTVSTYHLDFAPIISIITVTIASPVSEELLAYYFAAVTIQDKTFCIIIFSVTKH